MSLVPDTLVAADPFGFPWDDKVCVIQENEAMTVGSCPYNAEAIERVYGRELLWKLANEPTVCSTAIIGSGKTAIIHVGHFKSTMSDLSTNVVIHQADRFLGRDKSRCESLT